MQHKLFSFIAIATLMVTILTCDSTLANPSAHHKCPPATVGKHLLLINDNQLQAIHDNLENAESAALLLFGAASHEYCPSRDPDMPDYKHCTAAPPDRTEVAKQEAELNKRITAVEKILNENTIDSSSAPFLQTSWNQLKMHMANARKCLNALMKLPAGVAGSEIAPKAQHLGVTLGLADDMRSHIGPHAHKHTFGRNPETPAYRY